MSWGLSAVLNKKGQEAPLHSRNFIQLFPLLLYHVVSISKRHLIRIRAKRAALEAQRPVAAAAASPAEMPQTGYEHVLTCAYRPMSIKLKLYI